MGDHSKIEWTDATWNPVTGCTRVSEGCRNCYIERTPAFRIAGRKFEHGSTGVQLHPDRLGQPLKWKRSRRIFVNSLSDLFHEDVPDDFILECLTVMAIAKHHTFQVLTKRPHRMLELVSKWCAEDIYLYWHAFSGEPREIDSWPLPNVWLGVSIENQETANERIPLLLQTPAAKRFISAEPLLGPVELSGFVPSCACYENGEPHWDKPTWQGLFTKTICDGPQLDWVIVGGESGPGARPMHPDWARSIRDQCQAGGVPFFFKQWGEWAAMSQMPDGETPGCSDYSRHAPSLVLHPDGQQNRTYPKGAMTMLKIGKKFAGSVLDGREHKEWPR